MSDPYVYPGTGVLQNRLDIRDSAMLDRVEREFVVQRAREGVPEGNFDLQHLCAIHQHLFQDVYAWAGQIRTVEISKGGDQFQFRQFIETGVADIHRRLVADRFLKGTQPKVFTQKAAQIIGDLNYVHPFREGNGRTQLLYLKQLAERAGHEIDLAKIQPVAWKQASREAHQAQYASMAKCIERTIGRDRSR